MTTKLKDESYARVTERKRVILTGTVMASDGSYKVRIRDISSTGAQVMTDAKIPLDSDVIFKQGPVFAAARVAWSDDRAAGLSFYREIKPRN